MKNNHLVWFTAICLALIFYGLFSRYIALDALCQLHKEEAELSLTYEIITVSGNKIEHYNI